MDARSRRILASIVEYLNYEEGLKVSRSIHIPVSSTKEPSVDLCVVSIDRDDRKKKILFSYYPAAKNPKGSSPILHITSGHYLHGEDMNRRNEKRLEAVTDEVRRGIADKSGEHYERLCKACRELKLELV